MAISLYSTGVNFPDNTNQPSAAGYGGLWAKKFMNCDFQNTAYRHAFVIMNDNSVRGWGHGGNWRLGLGQNDKHANVAVKPAFPATFPGAAEVFTSNEVLQAVLDVNGQLWTWGVNSYGQCGTGNTSAVKIPTNVSLIASNSIYGKTVTKVAVPCGVEDIGFLMVLCSDGTVHACGHNGHGACGNGNTTNQSYFVRCGTLTGVTDISCGREWYTTCTAVAGGALYSWGYNGDWQFGNATNTSVSTPTLRNSGSLAGKTIIKARAGYLTCMALANDGTLHGAGNQNSGSFGLGNTTNQTAWVQLNTSVADFYNANYDYAVTMIRKYDNRLWLAGANNYIGPTVITGYDAYNNPQYGTASTTTWTQVTFPAEVNYSSVVPSKFLKCGTGSYNSFLCLMSDGSVYAWGYNGNGALGIGEDAGSSIACNAAKRVLIPTCRDIGMWGHGSETSSGFITLDERGLWGCGYGGTWANGWIQEVTQYTPVPIQIG